MRNRLAALLVVLAASLVALAPAPAATRLPVPGASRAAAVAGPALPAGVILRTGSKHAQQIKNLQWLLAGKKPNQMTFTPYFHWKPNGKFGARTARAVVRTKWRLGFPRSALKPYAGRQLELILEGRKRRPVTWVARAGQRIQAYITAHTPCADKLIVEATRYLGYHEIPSYSNGGPQVSLFQATTGQRGPWCASWVQSMLKWSGYGTVAHDSAYVPFIRNYAAWHQWLHAVARPGALAIFGYDYHHIGIVTAVTTVGVWTIEGNSGRAYGGSVRRVFYRYGQSAIAYAWLPGCVA